MGWCEWLEEWVSDEEIRKERRKANSSGESA